MKIKWKMENKIATEMDNEIENEYGHEQIKSNRQ